MIAQRQPEQFLDETKSLACVHCGLCLGSCPTYLETGNENESPRGRIYLMRAMQSGRIPVEQGSVRHIDLCLGCRACEAACPSGVQYGALLEQTRDFIEETHRRSPFQTFLRRVAIEKVFPYPARLKAALIPGRLLKATKLVQLLPAKLRAPLDLLPDELSSEPVPELLKSYSQPAKGRVGFIRGCAMDVMFNRTNHATIELIRLAGYEVVTPKHQVCCGALHAHSGRLNDARGFARKNIAAFKDSNLDFIVINAAGCGSTLKEYAHLLKHDQASVSSAEEFSRRVVDITEFLVKTDILRQVQRRPTSRVTYHDACHLAHAQRITKAPRDLVKAVARANYVELPESDVCCGSAGTYNLTEPEMAERLQHRKVQNILKTDALTVVTTNPGCMLQMQLGLRKVGWGQVKVMHIVDFLLESIQSKRKV